MASLGLLVLFCFIFSSSSLAANNKYNKKIKKKPKVSTSRQVKAKPPARTGYIFQTYTLGEEIDSSNASELTAALKGLGVAEVLINSYDHSVQVKFNSLQLSSIEIMQKLKTLGFTVKEIR